MGRYRKFPRGKFSRWFSAHVLASLIVTPFGPVQAASLHQITQADFNSDVPGQPPLTGGLNQPAGIFASPGATILVQSSANGITTQPVVITADAPSEYASVGFVFAPVSDGTLRLEATVAFDRLVDCYFLQTAVSPSEAVVTRLIATSAGEIQDDITRTTVGHYAANQPFRVRMDVDMTAKSWSVAIDNELDGFDDNPVVTNLPFENPLFAVPFLGFVGADLSVFPVIDLGASVAYDDISIFAPTVQFAAFSAKVKIALGSSTNDDTFKVDATFTLEAGSNGIAPSTEPVQLQVGTFTTTIPAGSFVPDAKGKFTFKGTIGGVALKARIQSLGGGSYAFKAESKAADLTGTVNPVTVALTIGDDVGSVMVTAKFK